MIRVQWQGTRLLLTGHAGSGEYGRDLVCAAVSILAHTLAANVRELEQLGAVEDVVVRLEAGRGEISCAARPQHRAAVELIFRAVCRGILLLGEQWPECVEVEG